MKTRTGFVSNSSSSSFVVLGAKMTKNDMWGIVFSDDDCRQRMFTILTEDADLQNGIEEMIGEPLTLENIATDKVLEAINEFAYDYDLMYTVPTPGHIDVHMGDECCDDEIVLGYHVCSLGYGIEDLTNAFMTAETHRTAIEEFFKDSKFKVGFYSVYTGF